MGFTPTPPSEISASVPPSVPGTGCGLGSPVGSVCDPATIPFHPAPQYLRKAERGRLPRQGGSVPSGMFSLFSLQGESEELLSGLFCYCLVVLFIFF